MVDTRALRARAAIAAWRFESSPRHKTFRGMAQLVERLVWDEEVARSNRATPTHRKAKLISTCGYGLMVEQEISNLFVGVRFSLPAPYENGFVTSSNLALKAWYELFFL